MSVNVHLSYSPVAVATHFMISIPFVPVSVGVATQVASPSGDVKTELSVPAVNACILMATYNAIRKYIGTENSLITDMGVSYCDGCANLHGAMHRFSITRASREIIKIFSKWRAVSAMRSADKYCAGLGFKSKLYKPMLREQIDAIDAGVPGSIDIYILTRNKNPTIPQKKEDAAAKTRRMAKQTKTITVLKELQAVIKQMFTFRRAGSTSHEEGVRYSGMGAFIISKLLNIPSAGSYIVNPDTDRIKAACIKFADKLKKKKRPEKALWHLITMAICNATTTAAALADFSSKIGNSEAITFIRNIHKSH